MPKRKPKDNIRLGDKVKLVKCYEARSGKYDGVVFEVTSEPWDVCGSQVVTIASPEKRFPLFATEFLERVS